MKTILCLIGGLLVGWQSAFAQIGGNSGDSRVKNALEKLGYKYDVNSTGRIKLTFKVTDERTQLIFINSSTENYENFEIREVWSPAYKSEGQLPRDVANRLLISSNDKKLGAWQVSVSDNTYLAVFSVKIAANSDSESLKSTMQLVMRVADEMEKELTGKDDY